MRNKLKPSVLLLALTLALVGPACGASSLGLTVHVVPLDADGGNTVRAHFSAIAAAPCPSLAGLCAAEEDCLVHKTSLPFTGTKPGSGWCVRQWQKTVPSNYKATISLGSNTEMYVSMNAAPKVRENSGKLNQPAYVGLLPPLRARVNCPHHFHLSVKDPDGDRVTCRFARPGEGECLSCTQHSFIELNEDKCMLTFTGKAPAGQYFIYLMAEDRIPVPKISHVTDNRPLSSVPAHLSLTVEESTTSCVDEPVSSGDTPEEDTMLFVLPFQQVQFNTDFTSQLESVSEVAVVGPPELFRVGFKSIGSLASMTMAWVRSGNRLPRLLPICFAANTESLQSEPRCVWLYQREMKTLPDGTVLTCEQTSMTLVLPVSSLSDFNLAELQLNSPACPVSYNSTHLTATISLTGCGTQTVHAGSELVFTNTLRSVRAYTKVSRQPSLELPLACRFPGVQAKGPRYNTTMPSEKETFGEIMIWLEVHLPGEGPLGQYTRDASLRALRMRSQRRRRDAGSPSARNGTATAATAAATAAAAAAAATTAASDASGSASGGLAVGSRLTELDLQVMSNCSIERAEMIVSNCIESETEDFAESNPILEQGCTASNSTLEVITTQSNSKVYRLDLSNVKAEGSTMYVRCTVNLCIATMPSDKCPSLCNRASSPSVLVNSVFTSTYEVSSGPVSLVVQAADPATTTAAATTAAATAATATTTTATATTTTAAATTTTATAATPTTTTTVAIATTTQSTTSHAPERTASVAAGLVLSTIGIFLPNLLLD